MTVIYTPRDESDKDNPNKNNNVKPDHRRPPAPPPPQWGDDNVMKTRIDPDLLPPTWHT